eukprot:TRINITY_DN63467_c0_g1_i1.p1 TRINITY_DN63467_c0_g1~~TRINITY_DN63467_c0_g1_i1.p1  ORF type:complete len:585 (-),score=129.91 TRINITY_DN63467_c0_g1_i1:88-1737(-)
MASQHRGSALERRYSFEYDVGQWTFGNICVIKDRESGELRNCKVVPKSLLRSRDGTLDKLKALRKLAHEHICGIHEVLEDQANYYIIIDFCSGGEVADWFQRLEEGYWLQEQTCAAYVRQALLALCHAHSQGVFHRDLTPHAMQLTSKMPDAQVKISDFGLASVLDSDNAIARKRNTDYLAPEVATSSAPVRSGAADMWSLGVIARTLLTGRAPGRSPNGTGYAEGSAVRGRGSSSGGLQWLSGLHNSGAADDEESWAHRSRLSRAFVQQLLLPARERMTAARALQHPWISGIQAISATPGQQVASGELQHVMLCYMLAVLLVPVLVPYRDFDQLRVGFRRADSDDDGVASRSAAARLLLERCPLREAVDAALNIVDVGRSRVFDLCAVACGDLIAREFFAAGPSSQPLVGPFGPADLAPRMLKRFFDTYGDRNRNSMVSLAGLRGRLRTATARDVETHAGVSYEEILADFPEDSPIDSHVLIENLNAGLGQGTPLGLNEDSVVLRSEQCTPWAGFSQLSLSDLFSMCGGPGSSSRRADSPHSVSFLVR